MGSSLPPAVCWIERVRNQGVRPVDTVVFRTVPDRGTPASVVLLAERAAELFTC